MRFPWVHVTAACESAAVWIPPGEPEMTPEQNAALERLVVAMLGARQAAAVLAVFELLNDAHPHDPPHHYLSLLATHDEHRGRGLGMRLLAASLEQIDREGSPAYLESTNPANDVRYMRLGFEPRAVVEVAGGQRVTTMWREARRPPPE